MGIVYRIIKGEHYDGLSNIIMCSNLKLAIRVAKHLSKKTFYDYGGGSRFLNHHKLKKENYEMIWTDGTNFVRIEEVRVYE